MAVPPAESQFASEVKPSNMLLYVGAGCFAISVLALVVGVLGIGWGMKKVGGVISEVKADPEKFAAEAMVATDPALELVTSDPARGEITFRNRRTGENRTVTYAEAAKGNLLIPAPRSAGAGTAAGSGPEAVGPPEWLPKMEGLVLSPAGLRSATVSHEVVRLHGTTSATPETVITFYSDELDRLGFTISRQSQTTAGSSTDLIEGIDVAGARQIAITVTRSQPGSPVMVSLTVEQAFNR